MFEKFKFFTQAAVQFAAVYFFSGSSAFLLSVLEIVDALNNLLQREQLVLLVELEQDHFFVEALDFELPLLELLALNARGVTGRSHIRQPLHLLELLSCVPEEPAGAEIIQVRHLKFVHEVINHDIGRRLWPVPQRVQPPLLFLEDFSIREGVDREQVLDLVHDSSD